MNRLGYDNQPGDACPEWEEALALYPDNLTPEEQKALETHVEQCICCAYVLADYLTIFHFGQTLPCGIQDLIDCRQLVLSQMWE